MIHAAPQAVVAPERLENPLVYSDMSSGVKKLQQVGDVTNEHGTLTFGPLKGRWTIEASHENISRKSIDKDLLALSGLENCMYVSSEIGTLPSGTTTADQVSP